MYSPEKHLQMLPLHTDVKIISLNLNAFTMLQQREGTAEVVPFNATVEAPKVKVTGTNKTSGAITLTEAEMVVSAGRGLKGPENWGMVEELAKCWVPALACSRPVADAHWRPHHEHVGQTGLPLHPILYIAIGIRVPFSTWLV